MEAAAAPCSSAGWCLVSLPFPAQLWSVLRFLWSQHCPRLLGMQGFVVPAACCCALPKDQLPLPPGSLWEVVVGTSHSSFSLLLRFRVAVAPARICTCPDRSMQVCPFLTLSDRIGTSPNISRTGDWSLHKDSHAWGVSSSHRCSVLGGGNLSWEHFSFFCVWNRSWWLQAPQWI